MEYTFFWKNKSPFSQWYGSWMNKNNETYDGSFIVGEFKYKTAEHYMMAEKALLFKDFETRHKILKETHPREVKKLGRLINNFNQEKWDEYKEEIVYQGNYVKFTQHKDLRRKLLNTNDTKLVEASPLDPIWGIGLDEIEAKELDEKYWPGQNLLGKALMRVREQIKLDIIYKTNEIVAFGDRLEKIKEAKNNAANKQNYAEAARLRDEEKAVEKEYQLLINYIQYE